jgi:hypothetical protein
VRDGLRGLISSVLYGPLTVWARGDMRGGSVSRSSAAVAEIGGRDGYPSGSVCEDEGQNAGERGVHLR